VEDEEEEKVGRGRLGAKSSSSSLLSSSSSSSSLSA